MDKFDVLDQIAEGLPNQISASLRPDRNMEALSEHDRMDTHLDDPLLYTVHCNQVPLRPVDKCTDASVKHKSTSEENMQAFSIRKPPVPTANVCAMCNKGGQGSDRFPFSQALTQAGQQFYLCLWVIREAHVTEYEVQ
jgi:hypothetical protein